MGGAVRKTAKEKGGMRPGTERGKNKVQHTCCVNGKWLVRKDNAEQIRKGGETSVVAVCSSNGKFKNAFKRGVVMFGVAEHVFLREGMGGEKKKGGQRGD